MRRIIKISVWLGAGLLSAGPFANCQGQDTTWNLQKCIDYALQNNIQIKKSKVDMNVSQVNLDEARAARFPDLSGGVNESYTHQQPFAGPSGSNSFTGNYSVHSGLMIYNGNKLNNTVNLHKLDVQSGLLNVEESENSIEIAVTSAYLQILYARENLTNAENTVKSSLAQLKEAGIKYRSGYISKSSYAQIEAQYSSDQYAEVQAKNNLDQQILALKQLLELNIGQSITIDYPVLSDSSVLNVIPPEEVVYKAALNVMPQVKNSQTNIAMAQLNTKIARASLLPDLSLSAGLSTGYNSDFTTQFSTQLGDNFYQNLGLTLSIPIYTNRLGRSAVSIAKLNEETAKLNDEDTRKTLLSDVESAYLNAVSAQGRFRSAENLLNSARISYQLTEQQFNLGMKNTVDLLTEKVKFLSAQQEYLQAKYSAILNYKLLDFYQGKAITL